MISPMKQTPIDPYFGPFLGALRDNLVFEGSEFGTGMFLFSLAVATRARNILEIGRNRGFSTLAFAGALKFNEMGWEEQPSLKQRPDVDYDVLEAKSPGKLVSLDVVTFPEATSLIETQGLASYVDYVTMDSKRYVPKTMFDIIFIDGDHSYQGCLHDVQHFIPTFLRPGGYFILHDYFGWYENGINLSPIKAVIEKECQLKYGHMLLDTGYQSLMVFNNPAPRNAIPGAVRHSGQADPSDLPVGIPAEDGLVNLYTGR